MRKALFAILSLLVLSGCKTPGYNPLKIQGQEEWRLTGGVERLLASLTGR